MGKLSLFCFFIMLFASCSVQKDIHGSYTKVDQGLRYDLELKEDSTFKLVYKVSGITSECEGKWYRVSEDMFTLKCNDVPIEAMLVRGYMSEREKKVIVLNEKKLKLGQVILKRVKE